MSAIDPRRLAKRRRDAKHAKNPARKKYHLFLSRRWQKNKNQQSKERADFHYRRFDDSEDSLITDRSNSIAYLANLLGRTRYSIQTRRKILTKLENIFTMTSPSHNDALDQTTNMTKPEPFKSLLEMLKPDNTTSTFPSPWVEFSIRTSPATMSVVLEALEMYREDLRTLPFVPKGRMDVVQRALRLLDGEPDSK